MQEKKKNFNNRIAKFFEYIWKSNVERLIDFFLKNYK